MIEVNDMKPGVTFKEGNDIFIVITASHSHQGRGQATVKLKVKNLTTGSITIKTISGGGKFEKAHISKENAIFSYDDGSNYVFMDENTYEQVEIPTTKLEWEKNFIIEGTKVILIKYESQILGITLKPSAELKISHTEPAVAGNTASGKTLKNATVETDFETQVPLFINIGDKVILSTEDGSYLGRGK